MGNDWSARFDRTEKKPLQWRTVFVTLAAGIVALPLSLIEGGPCGPGTLPGMIVMLIGIICLLFGLVMFVERCLIELKARIRHSR